MSGATRRLANKSILSRDLGARAVAHDEERRALERFGAKGRAKAGHAAPPGVSRPNLANRYLSEFVVSGTVVGKQCPRRRSPATTRHKTHTDRGRHDDTLK